MRLLRLALCFVVLHTTTALAADKAGNFALKGAGFLRCQVFVIEREKKSNVYYLIAGWVEGFISAHNKHVEDTYDILSFESLELLLNVIDGHCRPNPNDRLYSVLNSMIIQMTPDRLRQDSPRIEIGEGERKTILYRETIRRIQTRLAGLGLYKGGIDGVFTEDTQSALIAFQSDIGLETTGFPDQTTLWRLLRQ